VVRRAVGRGGGGLGALLVVLLALAPAAGASHPQPPLDISKIDYTPIGFFKPGDPMPSPTSPPSNPNPSGKYVAYDMNVYEALNLPSRHPGDESANDPPGTGDPRHGFCPPDPQFLPWGLCANHQLEYLDHFEKTMKEMLGDFGVVIKRYGFVSPGRSDAGTGRGGFLDAAGGQAWNISATVPGADHPDESVLVSGHYDFTDSGPAAAWDSSEGHTEVMRMAKIMSDYWRATGTRPSATVKFIPWDSEESGSFGSEDYVENNIPPGEEDKVRGYYNVDPCAGGYPAFKNGVPPYRIPQVLQLADPAAWDEGTPERRRIEAFNARASNPPAQKDVVDEIFAHLDSKDPGIELVPGTDQREQIFTPEQRQADVLTAVGGLAAFSSDYANFEAAGIPVFNFFPDVFGPHADPTSNDPRTNADGVAILHTPRDNLQTINQLTRADPSGNTASEGWAKGMEMCAQVESWGMLQHAQGGAQTSSPEVVAYYEALPNEHRRRKPVKFDASGSYQYSQLATRQIGDDSQLTYSWDFGDGTTGEGKVVEHAYERVGRYQSRLTVTSKATGTTDTMELPIEIAPPTSTGPVLRKPAPEDEDGTFPLAWDFAGSRSGFRDFVVEESSDVATPVADDAEGDINRLWQPSETGDPNFHPWQRSEGSPAVNGNQSHSGESSYWSGASPPAPSPTNKQSTLTLKQSFEVPKEGEATLSYFSLFQSESDDEGRVEVAIDEGDAEHQEWEAVDGVGGLFTASEPEGIIAGEFESRKVSLVKYKGKRIKIRFRYIMGPNDPAASQPAGWYIDDINVTSASWHEIGSTTVSEFTVFGKPAGTYAYRIIARFNDEIETLPSNAEIVKVTRGVVRDAGPGPGGTPRGPCTVGFNSAAALPRRRGGLRFAVSLADRRPFDVVLYRQSRGARVTRDTAVARFRNRTGSFNWAGRRGLPSGHYFARFRMNRGSYVEIRDRAVLRSRGGFFRRTDFQRRDTCGTLRSYRLSRSVFGGKTNRPLNVAFRLGEPATVGIRVLRRGRAVAQHAPTARLAETNYKTQIATGRGLPRGDYVVEITVTRGASTTRYRLLARRL
jgi:Zn-dependent M28 family amino/carboxypeptidase